MRLKLLLMTNMKSHMGFPLTPRSMTLDDLERHKFEFSVNFSRFRRFRTQQQLNEWRQASIVSDNVVSTSNWSNFWHALASRGFVSDSWTFLFINVMKLTNKAHIFSVIHKAELYYLALRVNSSKHDKWTRRCRPVRASPMGRVLTDNTRVSLPIQSYMALSWPSRPSRRKLSVCCCNWREPSRTDEAGAPDLRDPHRNTWWGPQNQLRLHHSALGALAIMRYTNIRFTYLLTYTSTLMNI